MEKRKTTRGTKRTVFIYLMIFAILYIIIYVVPQVSDIFVQTYSAEYGVLQIKDQSPCLFVRDEKVYKASNGGSVERVIQAGKLMRTKSRIVNVGGTGYYSDMKGIVSYYYDGYESVYTPDTMESLTNGEVEKISQAKDHEVAKAVQETAASGDVLFKIVDNQQWFLLSWLSQDDISKYSEGNRITVDFLDGSEKRESTQIEMTIYKLIPQGEQTLVILSCNRYYKSFDRYRLKECALITSNQSGILLETDSIVESEGQKGVYVVDKLGNYNFTPIKILEQDGDVTVVEKNYFYNEEGISVETVKNYDKILRPGKKSEK